MNEVFDRHAYRQYVLASLQAGKTPAVAHSAALESLELEGKASSMDGDTGGLILEGKVRRALGRVRSEVVRRTKNMPLNSSLDVVFNTSLMQVHAVCYLNENHRHEAAVKFTFVDVVPPETRESVVELLLKQFAPANAATWEGNTTLTVDMEIL